MSDSNTSTVRGTLREWFWPIAFAAFPYLMWNFGVFTFESTVLLYLFALVLVVQE